MNRRRDSLHRSKIESLRIGKLAAVNDGAELFRGAIFAASGLEPVEDLKAFDDSAENDVLPVEVGLRGEQDHELAAVGVLGVGHGEAAANVVIKVEVFIVELGAVDGLAAAAVPDGDVAALSNEARDHSVELGAHEVEGLA